MAIELSFSSDFSEECMLSLRVVDVDNFGNNGQLGLQNEQSNGNVRSVNCNRRPQGSGGGLLG